MRSVVLILLVALLPLRMWAAEGMAIRMAQAEMAGALHGVASESAMPDDCPMMAKAGGHDASHEKPGSSEPTGCVTCHLCAALAADTSVTPLRHALPQAPPDRSSPRFASAELARELRPPIS